MAGGRPRAPQFIVANTLPTESVLQEIIRHRDLVALSLETREVVNWLARYRLSKNTMQCGVSHGPCSLTAYHQYIDDLRWKCAHVTLLNLFVMEVSLREVICR